MKREKHHQSRLSQKKPVRNAKTNVSSRNGKSEKVLDRQKGLAGENVITDRVKEDGDIINSYNAGDDEFEW